MTLCCEAKWAKSVPGERVRSTLDDHCFRLVVLSDCVSDVFEELDVAFIFDSALERNIDRVVLALSYSNVFDAAGSREELPEFVE